MIDKMPLIKECVLPEPGRMLDPNDPDLGELIELIKNVYSTQYMHYDIDYLYS